ncbi:MAG: cation diffusion facilitator family transporter [Candidatus Micrarchaeia archaeon]
MARKRQDIGKELGVVLAITSATFVLEVAGGVWSNSLALLSDAGHVFGDLLSIALAFVAFKLAQKPSTIRRTFGYHRGEVLAALANSALLVAVAIFVILEALDRLAFPREVRAAGVLGVGFVGLMANVFVVFRLRGHTNLNIRAAVLHALGDTLSSVGVVIAGVLVALTGQSLFDPLVSLVIAGIILFSAYRIARTSLSILLESSPYGITAESVCAVITSVPGVLGAHDVHVWAICSDIIYVTAHVVVRDMRVSSTHAIGEKIAARLRKYNISHTAFQFETPKQKHIKGTGMVCEVSH